jgi:Flp pilus assembly protein TadG
MLKILCRLLNLHFMKSEEGANAAEFAMVALPMTIMTLIILEAGSLMFVYNDMHNAAREATRRLAVDESVVIGGATLNCVGAAQPTPVTAEYLACANLTGYTVNFLVDANITTGKPNGYSGGTASAVPYTTCDEVTVTVSTTMGSAALFNVFGILGTRPLAARSTMVTEYNTAIGASDPGSTCT